MTTEFNVISNDFAIRDVAGTASKGSFNLETKLISIRSDMDYSLHKRGFARKNTIDERGFALMLYLHKWGFAL